MGWRRLERRDAKKIQFTATRPRVTLTRAVSHSPSHLPRHIRHDRGTSSPPPPATPVSWLRRLLPRFTLVRTDPADLTHRLKHSVLLLVATSSAHPSNCQRGGCFVMRQLAPAVTNMVYSLRRPEYPKRTYGSSVERSRYTWRNHGSKQGSGHTASNANNLPPTCHCWIRAPANRGDASAQFAIRLSCHSVRQHSVCP